MSPNSIPRAGPRQTCRRLLRNFPDPAADASLKLLREDACRFIAVQAFGLRITDDHPLVGIGYALGEEVVDDRQAADVVENFIQVRLDEHGKRDVARAYTLGDFLQVKASIGPPASAPPLNHS